MRGNPFSAIFPRKSIFDHFQPFSTIFDHCLPGYLDYRDVKRAKIHFLPNNRGNPFSAIFNHFCHFGHGLPGYLDYRDGKHAEIHFLPNNRGNPFSAIFCHFRPFSAIACLATLLSITRNARKPMAANFSQSLQC